MLIHIARMIEQDLVEKTFSAVLISNFSFRILGQTNAVQTFHLWWLWGAPSQNFQVRKEEVLFKACMEAP